MTKFNVGDKIKLVNDEDMDYNLTLGKVYVVRDLTTSGSCVYITDNDGEQCCPYASRFEPVKGSAPNGVDANGKPLFFGRDDLKSLQRVVLADGRTGMISTEGFGHYGVCVVYDTGGSPYGSFDPAQVNCEFYQNDPYLNIVEVYANPGHGNVYKQSARGNLIWKADSKAVERTAADEAVAAAEAALAEAQAALDAASAKRAAL